jgi:hypothetical protein
MTKRRPSPEHANTLSLKALRGLVTGLVDRVEVLSAEVKELREKNAVLCEENEILRLENARLKSITRCCVMRSPASKICRLDHRFARPAWTRQRTPCPPTDRGRRNPADQSSM